VTTWDRGLDATYRLDAPGRQTGGSVRPEDPADPRCPRVVALDFGMKWNILRHLVDLGCKVTVVPGSSTADEILDFDPDGIFISNGPGDPRPLIDATATLRGLIRTASASRGIPIFGICLGHQLLGQAFGARTFKLKFGHRGANHPVRNQATGKVEITTQNHGFAVDPSTLPADVEPSHLNLNDQTLEGLRHKRLPVFGVQYHPEASAGPHDSAYLFDEFRRLILENT
jgi:carbamoyl-phosphate synthase small subunit